MDWLMLLLPKRLVEMLPVVAEVPMNNQPSGIVFGGKVIDWCTRCYSVVCTGPPSYCPMRRSL